MYSRQRIIELLERLNDELARSGTTAEICLFGGAAMVLAFDAREATRDVDAVFVPTQRVRDAIAAVAQDESEPQDWMNDAVKGFISTRLATTDDGLPVLSHVRLLRATDDYLLAMKCLAARAAGFDTGGDLDDATLLVRRMGLRSVDGVLDVIQRYYHDGVVPARTRYFVDEVIDRAWTQDPPASPPLPSE